MPWKSDDADLVMEGKGEMADLHDAGIVDQDVYYNARRPVIHFLRTLPYCCEAGEIQLECFNVYTWGIFFD